MASQPPPTFPETGLAILSLQDGKVHRVAGIGSDLVAVTVSDDGRPAYLADSSPGDVYAVSLPDLKVRWKAHLGGAPFGLLVTQRRLYVSLFDKAQVEELDPASGDRLVTHAVSGGPAAMAMDGGGRIAVATLEGKVFFLDGTWVPGGQGYGVAFAAGGLWSADFKRGELVETDSGWVVLLPLRASPFWLATGSDGTLLITGEGRAEDSDPGGVFSYDSVSGKIKTLGQPRDPDPTVESGSTIFVAAHGDRDVLAIRSGRTEKWAAGAAAVAIAAHNSLGLLVAVNAHE